ncbi:MAG: hypothetical protein J0M19_05030 [Sphingomonadales bacterium]|nr:hypothetical protein [Sphingomonadales bacterium]
MPKIDWRDARAAQPDDLGLTRRGAMATGFAAFTVCALLAEVSCARPARSMPARTWIDRQAELARALRKGEVLPLAWMTEVTRLAGEIDVAELMAEVDRAKVSAVALSSTNDPAKRSIRFVDENGEPRRLGFAAALFDFTPGNVITPHGHSNMVSSHLVVKGQFRVRNFDRIGDEAGAMIIRPSRDYIAGPGDLSAMSSAKDNIHWFVPHAGAAQTFDVIISGIDAALPDYAIQAIDPLGGQHRADGSIKAPLMGFADASIKYTAAL